MLLPLSLLLALVGILGYLWAARRGQFDDLDTPPMRILFEEESEEEEKEQPTESSTESGDQSSPDR